MEPPRRAASYTPPVSKGRLEAFSDGVIAILITIMVLELHVPHEPDDLGAAPAASRCS